MIKRLRQILTVEEMDVIAKHRKDLVDGGTIPAVWVVQSMEKLKKMVEIDSVILENAKKKIIENLSADELSELKRLEAEN